MNWAHSLMRFFAIFVVLWPFAEAFAYMRRRMRRQQNFIHARPDERFPKGVAQ